MWSRPHELAAIIGDVARVHAAGDSVRARSGRRWEDSTRYGRPVCEDDHEPCASSARSEEDHSNLCMHMRHSVPSEAIDDVADDDRRPERARGGPREDSDRGALVRDRRRRPRSRAGCPSISLRRTSRRSSDLSSGDESRSRSTARRSTGLFDDSEVEAHGLKGAIAIAVTSAAILVPAGQAARSAGDDAGNSSRSALPQRRRSRASRRRLRSPALQAKAQVTSQVAEDQWPQASAERLSRAESGRHRAACVQRNLLRFAEGRAWRAA